LISYRLYPFQIGFCEVRLTDVSRISIRKYRPLSEFGGWGIRYGRSGAAVNLRGNIGIQVEFRNGKKLLIGTSQEDLMRRALINAGFAPAL
jgi:hypothetical protein